MYVMHGEKVTEKHALSRSIASREQTEKRDWGLLGCVEVGLASIERSMNDESSSGRFATRNRLIEDR